MSNLTDALIAAKLVGGSGGSGGGSGLPEITPGDQTVVVAERSVSFSAGQGGLYFAMFQSVTLASGVTYTVTWNGTTYTCVGSEIPMGDETGIGVGNLSIVGAGADTGEPFFFAHESVTTTEAITTTAGPHTIGVTTGTPQTPPDGYVLGIDGGEWKAVPSGGSGGGETTTPLIVKIDWDDNLGPDGGYFADHTYNEVRDAIDNGQIVIGTAFGFYALTEDARGAGVGRAVSFSWTTFSLAVSASNHQLMYEKFTLHSDNTVTSYAGYVNLTDL